MGKKIRLKQLGLEKGTSSNWVEYELEELSENIGQKDCPASECDGEECECNNLTVDKIISAKKSVDDYYYKQNETFNDSLEIKMLKGVGYTNSDQAYKAIKIAREHFQKHPEEICNSSTHAVLSWKQMEAIKGMVSIDKVLKVLDSCIDMYQLRKAIETMKEQQKEKK